MNGGSRATSPPLPSEDGSAVKDAERNLAPMTGRLGQYAGVASRGLAFGVDLGALWGLYVLGAYGFALLWQLIDGSSYNLGHHQTVAAVVLTIWWFVYFAAQWAAGGRTLGMALFGIRVVQKDGRTITKRQALLRAALLYFSFLFFVVAALFILFQRERRTIHDLIARTAVVYSWDAKAARLRWLVQREQSQIPVDSGP